jgi:hypothetical protein
MSEDAAVPNQPGGPAFSSLVKKEIEKYQCEKPLRGVAVFGTENVPFVLDSAGPASTGYDTLYIDLNRNGDLTDDKAIKALPIPAEQDAAAGFLTRTFPPSEVFRLGAEGAEYAVQVDTMSIRQETMPVYHYVMIRSAVYREGDITLDGKQHHIVLVDHNSNGRFNDPWVINEQIMAKIDYVYPTPGDVLFMDPDMKDRRIYGAEIADRKDQHPVSKSLVIDGHVYDVTISPAGDTLTLLPSQSPVGFVRSANQEYSAVLYGDKGFLKIGGTKSGSVPVPEGDWRLLRYVIDLSKTDTTTETTRVTANGAKGGPVVKVEKGKTVDLAFGPPYRGIVKVSGYSPSQSSASLSMSIVGSASETCSGILVKGKQPEKPKLVIATADGKIVDRGAFEYG